MFQSGRKAMALRKFIIERDIPKVGTFEREQLRGAAQKSNGVLRQLGPDIQWLESYVADDKTFCVYLAKDEDIIRKHEEMSGFPATKITEVRKMIDPTPEDRLPGGLGVSPVYLRKAAVNELVSLNPTSIPISVTDRLRSASKLLARSMRLLVRYWCGGMPNDCLNAREKWYGLSCAS